jgi:hypothetical protein
VVRRKILGEIVQLTPGAGRVGGARPLVEFDDGQPPVPQGPFETPDDGLPLGIRRSVIALHPRPSLELSEHVPE